MTSILSPEATRLLAEYSRAHGQSNPDVRHQCAHALAVRLLAEQPPSKSCPVLDCGAPLYDGAATRCFEHGACDCTETTRCSRHPMTDPTEGA